MATGEAIQQFQREAVMEQALLQAEAEFLAWLEEGSQRDL